MKEPKTINKEASDTKIGVGGNREYKDTLFRKIFGENLPYLLSLYNALNGSFYTEARELELVTMEDVLFVSMKNDIAFILDDEMNLYEHQSTVNPNMPVRGFMYSAKLVQNWLAENRCDIYRSRLIKIPTPRYTVFYNGNDAMEDVMTLRLSDAFINPPKEGCYEWTATVYNINPTANRELMEKCKALREYAAFVQMVKDGCQKHHDTTKAIEEALEKAIEENFLDGYFRKEKEAVFMTTLYEVDKDIHENNLRQDAWEKGLEEGMEKGIQKGTATGQNLILSLIEQLMSDNRMEDVKKITKDTEYKNLLLKEYQLLR